MAKPEKIKPDKLKGREKEAHDKVKRLVKDMETHPQGYRVVARTSHRDKMGLPDVELINPSLEEALKDLDTIEHRYDGEPA